MDEPDGNIRKPTLVLVESNIYYYGLLGEQVSAETTELRSEHADLLRTDFKVFVVDDVRFLEKYFLEHPECHPDIFLVRLPFSWSGWIERLMPRLFVPGFHMCIQNITVLRTSYPQVPIVGFGFSCDAGWQIAKRAGVSQFINLLRGFEYICEYLKTNLPQPMTR